MFNPVATYRIQFNKDFTFKDLDTALPYLTALGVKTIYASPIFASVPGSMHGYDVTNPYEINPEIGSEEELYQLHKKLSDEGMAWIQDIVPNHMAFHHDNTWLMDVLEKGSISVYASFFDITWSDRLFHGKLMVPFLGDTLEATLQKNELQIVYDKQRLLLKYYDSFFSLNSKTYKTILGARHEFPPVAIQLWLEQLNNLHKLEDAVQYSLRWHELLLQFTALMQEEDSHEFITRAIAAHNEDSLLLKDVITSQYYRLCSWEETNRHINYRRFFTVNGLICLNMQSPKVFEQYHKKIKQLIDDGIFQGLRVDHVDGLADPKMYLERLRELAGNETYIVVEKILEPGEDLPAAWPVQGTTGYDFLAIVNNLFTQNNAEKRFTKIYDAFLRDKRSVSEKIREKKSFILFEYMGGELKNLGHLLLELNLIDENDLRKIPPEDIIHGIAEFLIQCPVYRYYGNQCPLDKNESMAVRKIFDSCRRSKPALSEFLWLLEHALIDKTLIHNSAYNERAIEFYKRCMQFTGPLMAKGVEDTLMYTFNRFIGHNEVGDSPEYFGLTTEDFHRHMMTRQRYWPLALNATSTHDTKRGEEVRMRLNVLPDLAEEWTELVQTWRASNNEAKEQEIPDANDEYFLYQTLVGTFPMTADEIDDYRNRLDNYLVKSLRESKRNSNWARPNEHYEELTKRFTRKLLDTTRPFWKSFETFQQKVSDFGILNSLAQVLLKFTCPGVPDIYQGTALWDLSMVDPDNRRPVDYSERTTRLEMVSNHDKGIVEHIQELWQKRVDAGIKLWLTQRLLRHRHEHTDVFTQGLYIPLQTAGRYKNNIVAFARRYRETWYIIAIPLYMGRLCADQKKNIRDINWEDTRIIVPGEAPSHWYHGLTETKNTHNGTLSIGDIFIGLPIAFIKLQHTKITRSAGVLMPIASLPSSFGIGDFGKKARDFADFLSRSGQTIWQLLPLNPVTCEADYSPYSSHSSMACSPLYISLEMLAAEGLLDINELKRKALRPSHTIHYREAEKTKCALLDHAWSNFKNKASIPFKKEFENFAYEQAAWLDDFALFVVIKTQHDNKPWYEWPDDYRLRNTSELESFSKKNQDELNKIKWQQFIALRHWKALREYCNNLNIQLLGDLPFYVSYDSVDVWAHTEIFSVDENGSLFGVAGVPPDYFNDEGQLWGMPVFRWDVLKKQGYRWWVDRLRKNMELFDLLRLDHFRAFANYWEVPAKEKNAIHGKWKSGPGAAFFKVIEHELGHLPFIAEDLGEIDEKVFALRDKLGFPGMKVLQFAFDKNMPRSIYIPHEFTSSFVVYTGTHDNNTTRGWYRKDTTSEDRARINAYLNKKVNEKNISEELIRMAYGSVAKIAIIPIQDILNLDERARVNTPSTRGGNWRWQLQSGTISTATENKLREWATIFGRS